MGKRVQDNWVVKEGWKVPGIMAEELGDLEEKLWSDHDTSDEEAQIIPEEIDPTLPPGIQIESAVLPPPGMNRAMKRMARLQVQPNSYLARNRRKSSYTAPGSVKTSVPAADTRLDPEKDSGATQAQEYLKNYFCWRFARGHCSFGPSCKWLHRVPNMSDHLAGYINIHTDIFGRNRRRTDDLSNTTLFVTGIQPSGVDRIGGWPTVEKQAMSQFALLGEVESIKGLPSQGTVFVRYRTRINAEFAREVMIGQSLQQMGDGEVLRIKWAKEDPDPVMKEQNKYETLSKLWDSVDDHGAATDISIHKKARLTHSAEKYVQLCAVEELYVKPATDAPAIASLPSAAHYPNTDSQYPSEEAAGWTWNQTTQKWDSPQCDGWGWNDTTKQWERNTVMKEPVGGLVAGYTSD